MMHLRLPLEQRKAVTLVRRDGGSVVYNLRDSSGIRRDLSGDEDLDPVMKRAPPRWVRTLMGDDLFGQVVGATVCTNESMGWLRMLPQIRVLRLIGSQITDGGMTHISHLRDLRKLIATDTRITDQSLTCLSGMVHLRWLDLSDTAVTDAGLATLQSMHQLEFIDLTHTNITDQGLAYTRCRTGLEELEIAGTAVTPGGVDLFKEMRPDVCIVYS